MVDQERDDCVQEALRVVHWIVLSECEFTAVMHSNSEMLSLFSLKAQRRKRLLRWKWCFSLAHKWARKQNKQSRDGDESLQNTAALPLYCSALQVFFARVSELRICWRVARPTRTNTTLHTCQDWVWPSQFPLLWSMAVHKNTRCIKTVCYHQVYRAKRNGSTNHEHMAVWNPESAAYTGVPKAPLY